MFKKVVGYFVKVLKSPYKEVAIPQGLEWNEIGLAFILLTFSVVFFTGLATGPVGFLMVFPFAVVGTVFQALFCLALLGVVAIALKVMQINLIFKDLAETFLTALVPVCVISVLLISFNIFIGSMGVTFSVGMISSLLVGFFFFLGLKGRFLIKPEKALVVAAIVVALLMLPVFYSYR